MDPALGGEHFDWAKAQFAEHVAQAQNKRYSPAAASDYGVAVAVYASRLRGLAEGKAKAEMVLAEHVQSGVTDLGPDTADALKTFVDWLKRVAFVALGLAIAQGVKVSDQDPLVRGSVVWLAWLIAATFLMLGLALGLDYPKVRAMFRWRHKRQTCPVCLRPHPKPPKKKRGRREKSDQTAVTTTKPAPTGTAGTPP